MIEEIPVCQCPQCKPVRYRPKNQPATAADAQRKVDLYAQVEEVVDYIFGQGIKSMEPNTFVNRSAYVQLATQRIQEIHR